MQTAVEVENHLIAAHEVTMHGYDRDALSMMGLAARDAMVPVRIEAIGARLQLMFLQLSLPDGMDFDGICAQSSGCCSRS